MKIATNVIIALSLLGCGADDPFGPRRTDRFGFESPVGDDRPRHPEADDTPRAAPFAPGQRRGVEDADAVFRTDVNEHVEGVLMPGDLDGDGYGDLVLWSNVNNDPNIVECEMGCPGFIQLGVYIAYGGPGLGADPVIRPQARITGWHVTYGSSPGHVASAGDVDGDGLPDLLVSVGDQQGNVFELRGGPRLAGVMDIRDVGSMTRETGSGTDFGDATGVGDIDGDGLSDYVVAATVPGRAYLYYGRGAASTGRRSEADADATLVGASGARIGWPEPAGDVDGDGLDDFLLSPPDDGSRTHPVPAGTWRLVYGSTRLEGEVDVETLATRIEATSVRSVGDLDEDGRSELGVARATTDESDYLLPGRTDRPRVAGAEDGGLPIVGTTIGEYRRGWFRHAGDLNHDGRGDVIYTAGDALHILLSPISMAQPGLDLDTSVILLGRGWEDNGPGLLGSGVAAGSDLNGDGLDDLAFVARRDFSGTFVYLWLGRS